MSPRWLLALTLPLVGMLAALPAAAQLHPQEPDPLAKIRAAADGQACSTAETSACAQANPKILAAAMGPSPLEKNLHKLQEITPRITGTHSMDRAVAWAVAAFHDEGLEAHVEKYPAPQGGAPQENVVAEIRGREKPDDFVLVGAILSSADPGEFADVDAHTCDASLMVEAARDILATGLRPRRSIRFVLFSGTSIDMRGSWAYVEAHSTELDHDAAAILNGGYCAAATGFTLGGREELEPAIREALDFPPLKPWDIAHDLPRSPSMGDSVDFMLEGIPTFQTSVGPSMARPRVDLQVLRRNTAVIGILAFALAEHATPPGPRLTHDQIGVLLARFGLDDEMKSIGTWDDWESGKRGRQP